MLLRRLTKPMLAAIAGGVLLTNGCQLPHAQLRYSKSEPALYCPGDTIQTSYDLGACTPHSGITCESRTPTVALTTTSSALPSRSFNAFAGSASFAPTESSIDVVYTVSPVNPMYPYVDSTGANKITGRNFDPETTTITRIDGEALVTLEHNGICNGRIPMSAPAAIPASPRVSARGRAQRICNANPVRIMIDVVGPPGAPGASGSLAPGECLALPPGNEGAMVSVSGPIAPGATCLPTQTTGLPQMLKTQVAFNCVD